MKYNLRLEFYKCQLQDKLAPMPDHYAGMLKEADRKRTAIERLLAKDEIAVLDSYLSAHDDVESSDRKTLFTGAFRMGALLMTDILQCESPLK